MLYYLFYYVIKRDIPPELHFHVLLKFQPFHPFRTQTELYRSPVALGDHLAAPITPRQRPLVSACNILAAPAVVSALRSSSALYTPRRRPNSSAPNGCCQRLGASALNTTGQRCTLPVGASPRQRSVLYVSASSRQRLTLFVSASVHAPATRPPATSLRSNNPRVRSKGKKKR